MARVLATVVGLTALIVTPGYLFYFDVTPKLAVLLLGLAAAALFPTRTDYPPTMFSYLVGLSLISLVVSTALSSNPALSIFGTAWRRYGAIAQAATLLFAWTVAGAGKACFRPILRSVAVVGLLTGAYGIAQYLGWDPLLPAAAYHIGEGIWTIVRPPGTLGYASYFATWLLCVIFLSVALAWQETGRVWRLLAAGSATVAAAAMLGTGTRAALLGVVAGALVWAFCWGPVARQAAQRIWRRAALAGALLTVVLVAFFFSPAGWQLRSRTRWFVEDPWGGARPRLWMDSLGMAAHRLPAGYGPEVFTALFPHFESRELARAYPDFAHESPHNIFLDALVQQGVPGLLLLLAFCAAGFGGAWRLRREQPGLAAGLAGALAAAIVSQQFTVFTIPTALIFYVTIGLAMGTTATDATATDATATDATATGLRPTAWNWRAAAATLPLALALIYLAIRVTAADRALELSRQAIAAGDAGKAAAEYTTYTSRRLPGIAADLWYSRALMGLAQKAPNPLVRFQALTQSGAAAVRATQTAEEPFNAWYNAAELSASQNDAAGAVRCLRAAIAAHPNWFKPHWTLAQVLSLESRWNDAAVEAALAADLDGGKHPEVARTAEEIRRQYAAHRVAGFNE